MCSLCGVGMFNDSLLECPIADHVQLNSLMFDIFLIALYCCHIATNIFSFIATNIFHLLLQQLKHS